MATDVNILFQVEHLDAALDDCFGLLRLHWDEVCAHKAALRLDPDLESYRTAERAGKLLIVTARIQGQLIGYAVALLHRNWHYRDIMDVDEDIHFLHQSFRRAWTGVNLIRSFEEYGIAQAINLGAKRGKIQLNARVKCDHDHSAIYEMLGYRKQDIVLTKIV